MEDHRYVYEIYDDDRLVLSWSPCRPCGTVSFLDSLARERVWSYKAFPYDHLIIERPISNSDLIRCIKGALEYANVMSFTHVSTAHYTYSGASFPMLHAPSVRYCGCPTTGQTLWPWYWLWYLLHCYNESATRMLLPQSFFAQWFPLFCYSIWTLSLHVIGYDFILDYWNAVRVVPEQVWAPFISVHSLLIFQFP